MIDLIEVQKSREFLKCLRFTDLVSFVRQYIISRNTLNKSPVVNKCRQFQRESSIVEHKTTSKHGQLVRTYLSIANVLEVQLAVGLSIAVARVERRLDTRRSVKETVIPSGAK